MSVFHQIGHHSMNLVSDEDLSSFKGLVCSPLNYSQAEVTAQCGLLPSGFLSIFDPHLYFPRSNRGKLHTWDYFPNDFDTAEQTNINWRKKLSDNLLDTCVKLKCSHLCSPSCVPTKFSEDYFRFYVDVGNYLYEKAHETGLGFYQSAIIDYKSMKEPSEPEIIASILSQTTSNSIYLIIKADIDPRRELSDSDAIAGIMKLIRLLSNSGIEVFVSYCSTDFILWKLAGAKDFATGKFFNLRRFTQSRFEEPSGGGGQLPYWFEKNLLAYLRESDLVRVKKADMLNYEYENNPFSLEILNQFETAPGNPWLALSWKNYLYTFALLEANLTNDDIPALLKTAEDNWLLLDDKNILMDEPRNNGSWIRQWRIAVNSYYAAISEL